MKIELNSQYKINRVIAGKNEAIKNLNRELKYSEDLRDLKSIELSEKHIAIMDLALKNGFIIA